MELDKHTCNEAYLQYYNLAPAGLGATKAALSKLLRSIDLVGWSTHEETGRVDRRALTRFATGSTAVFSRRAHVEAETSAVSVLIDCSGSMAGQLIQTAAEVTIQLSRLLDQAKVPFKVTGFSGGGSATRMDGSGANEKDTYVRTERVNFFPFKTWAEPMRKASTKLGAIRFCAGSSTPDFSALSLTIDDIAAQPQTRKIIFLLTDADGYSAEQMEFLQSRAERAGVIIIAVGIGTTAVKMFKHHATVNKVEDLGSKAFGSLLKTVRK
jgi:cobalamin biosynthesis protein CobT